MCRHPWSKVNRCYCFFLFPFISFHCLSLPFMLHSFPLMFVSCCIHFLSRPINFLSCSFHLAFISFHFPLLVSHIQVFERWYAQTGQVGICPNVRDLLLFRYRFAIISKACAVAIFRVHEHVQVYGIWMVWVRYRLYSCRFFWAGNALVVLRGKASQAKMKGLLSQIALRRYSHTVFRVSS